MLIQLVRMACLGLSAANLQEVLDRRALSAEQLSQLSVAWDGTESNDAMESTIIGDRALINGLFQHCAERPASWREEGRFSPAWILGWRLKLFRGSGSLDYYRLKYLMAIDSLCVIARQPLPQRLGLVRKWVAEPKGFATREFTSYMDTIFDKHAKSVATIRTTRVGLLVEQYRLEKGERPALLPATTLTDPFTGQPLRYKRLAKGYVVYSVGEDGADDGGDEKKDVCFTVTR